MLFAEDARHIHHIALLEGRQSRFAVVAVAVVVTAFLIHRDEAGKHQGLPGCPELVAGIAGCGQIDADRIKPGRCHLAGHGALPDHLVQAQLFRIQPVAQTGWRAGDRRRSDGLVRFLGILRLVGKHHRVGRQIFAVEIVFHPQTDVGNRFLAERHRIGSHVGNQADRTATDIDAFIQLLRHLHGAVGGET